MSAEATFPTLNRGVFTISIDLELAWGVWDLPLTSERLASIAREREMVEPLLSLFRRFSMRATWAVVGHLLLDRWPVDDEGRPHPDLPRPFLKGEERDHFFQLPGERHPAWWGADLVEAVRAARPPQEIGSHSFCHLPYDEGRACRPAVEGDLAMARRLHGQHDLSFVSFVFPRNVVGFKPALRRAGIRVFRGVTPRWYDPIRSRPILRGARLVSELLRRTPPTVRPRRDGGMVSVADSQLLRGRQGLRRLLPAAAVRDRARRGLKRAVRRREVYHLWFHLSNLVTRSRCQLDVLEAILESAHQLIERGELENWTMGDFATLLDREAA